MRNVFKYPKGLILAGLSVIVITAAAWQTDNKDKKNDSTRRQSAGDTVVPKQRNPDKDEFRMKELDEAMKELDIQLKDLNVEISKTVKEALAQVDFEKIGKEVEAQLKQVDLIKTDLANGIKRVEAQVNNGTAFRSNISLLQAEMLDADQRAIEIKATRNGFLQMLALFINQPLTAETQLQTPAPFEIVSANSTIARPELQFYSSTDKFLSGQTELIESKNHPRVSLFLQAGYGRPGLNFLKNEFDPYYVGGVRVNWTIGGYYTQKKEKELVEVNRKMVDAQKDAFLLTTRTSLVQQLAEIDRMQQLVNTDQEIIELRIKVKDAARAHIDLESRKTTGASILKP